MVQQGGNFGFNPTKSDLIFLLFNYKLLENNETNFIKLHLQLKKKRKEKTMSGCNTYKKINLTKMIISFKKIK